MRALLRLLGFRVHRFRPTHPSGYIRECTICGEEQQKFVLWVKGTQPEWWETTHSGNGRCSEKPLPTRIY